MALSKKYIFTIVFGWGFWGLLSYVNAYNFIGGVATFFIMFALASWSIFPITHLLIAVLLAKRTNNPPSALITGIGVSLLLIVLALTLTTSLFNYV